MEPMRSIFIPKHPLPPTMELRPRLVILDCCCRKSSKKAGTPSEPLANPLNAAGLAPNLLGGPGRLGNSSTMSSVVTGAEMIEESREPKRARKTWPREAPPGTRAVNHRLIQSRHQHHRKRERKEHQDVQDRTKTRRRLGGDLREFHGPVEGSRC